MNNKRRLVPLLPNSLISSSPSPSISLPSPSCSKIIKSKSSRKQKSLSKSTKLPKVTTTIINKNPPNSLDQPKPRHLKSCSRCRKHKTKCNYIDTAPNPCTSCSKKGLTCQLEIVISVKRSNIIKNLATSVQDLKNSVEKLVEKDKFLKTLCIQKGLKIDGLIDLDYDLLSTITPTVKLENNHSSVPMSISNSSSLLSNLDITDVETYSSEELLSDVDFHSTCCSSDNDNDNDDNDDDDDDDDENFVLNDNFQISLDDSSKLLNSFNLNYLPLIPIFTEFRSPFQLYNYSKLLFWTIIFITTKNQFIYDNFIQSNVNDTNIENESIIESILLLSCFPCEIIDVTTTLNLLKFANKLPQTNIDLSSYLYILGNIHCFKNGLKWSINDSKFLEIEKRSQINDFIGNLLKFIILESRLINDLVFEFENQNDSSCSVLLQNSINSWRFQLNTLTKSNSNDLILISCMELSMCLFEINDNDLDKELNLAKSFKIIDQLYNYINSLSVEYSPIWVKFALEFITLVSFKLMFASYNDDKLNSNMFVKCFNKLIQIEGYSSIIIKLILEFQSVFKINSSIVNYLNTNTFKFNLMEGLLNDLKNHINLMKTQTLLDYNLLPQLSPIQFHNLSKILNKLQSLTLDQLEISSQITNNSNPEVEFQKINVAEIETHTETETETQTETETGSATNSSLSLTTTYFPQPITPSTSPEFSTSSNSPLHPSSTMMVEDDEKSLNLTIYNLVNNENIDFFEKSQEENLDVINSILKGMDTWSSVTGNNPNANDRGNNSGMIC